MDPSGVIRACVRTAQKAKSPLWGLALALGALLVGALGDHSTRPALLVYALSGGPGPELLGPAACPPRKLLPEAPRRCRGEPPLPRRRSLRLQRISSSGTRPPLPLRLPRRKRGAPRIHDQPRPTRSTQHDVGGRPSSSGGPGVGAGVTVAGLGVRAAVGAAVGASGLLVTAGGEGDGEGDVTGP